MAKRLDGTEDRRPGDRPRDDERPDLTLLAYRPLAGRAAAADTEDREAGGDNPGPLDWALAAMALVCLVYPLLVFDDVARRVVRPTGLDVLLGVVAVLLVLEATRRTVGRVLPAICLAFVAYAFFGGLLPFGWELGHKGYDLERLVGQAYMGIEGLFGVPLDVAATYIVLFTIYGAVLKFSGAGPVLHRRQLRRLRDPLGGRPRPHRHPGRVPARDRVRVGGGDHGHPGVGGLAGAAPGRGGQRGRPAHPGRRGAAAAPVPAGRRPGQAGPQRPPLTGPGTGALTWIDVTGDPVIYDSGDFALRGRRTADDLPGWQRLLGRGAVDCDTHKLIAVGIGRP